MAKTRTTSTWLQAPRTLHAGANVVYGEYNSATHGEASIDGIVLLAKIPDQARITDFWARTTTDSTLELIGTFGIRGGATASLSAFGPATFTATATSAFRANKGLGTKISMTTTDGVDWASLVLKSGTWTASDSVFMKFAVTYYID